MVNIRLKKQNYLWSFFVLSLFVMVLPHVSLSATDTTTEQQELDAINAKKDKKEVEHKAILDRITRFTENLKSKQQERVTLENQVEVIEQDIQLAQTKIEKTAKEIELTELQIQETKISINKTQQEIDQNKDQIALLIRDLYDYDQQTYLERLITHSTLSEISSQIQYIDKVNSEFQKSLEVLKQNKQDLKQKKQELGEYQEEQITKQSNLEIQKDGLDDEQRYKNNLIEEVGADEEKFQALIAEIKLEQERIDSEISRLDKSSRTLYQEIAKQQQTSNPVIDPVTGEESNTTIILPDSFTPDWPVNGVITTYFRDPNYIFRNVFPHTAIDIAAAQGTPIRAADSGVVSVVYFPGTTAYSWVAITHADQFSTSYGHISAVYVEPEQVVEKGQVIAAIGGSPGTVGSGSYTTGSHVHFQVSANGIAVDPLQYLP